jgi:hypothetical protein
MTQFILPVAKRFETRWTKETGVLNHPLYTADQMQEVMREHDAKWTAMLNRRVAVEQLMFDAARGKRPMPTAQELREWALRLGTPADADGVPVPHGGGQ